MSKQTLSIIFIWWILAANNPTSANLVRKETTTTTAHQPLSRLQKGKNVRKNYAKLKSARLHAFFRPKLNKMQKKRKLFTFTLIAFVLLMISLIGVSVIPLIGLTPALMPYLVASMVLLGLSFVLFIISLVSIQKRTRNLIAELKEDENKAARALYGKATPADIIQKYGAPNRITTDGKDGQIIVYEIISTKTNSYSQSGGTVSSVMYKREFYFDKNGLLYAHRFVL